MNIAAKNRYVFTLEELHLIRFNIDLAFFRLGMGRQSGETAAIRTSANVMPALFSILAPVQFHCCRFPFELDVSTCVAGSASCVAEH